MIWIPWTSLAANYRQQVADLQTTYAALMDAFVVKHQFLCHTTVQGSLQESVGLFSVSLAVLMSQSVYEHSQQASIMMVAMDFSMIYYC